MNSNVNKSHSYINDLFYYNMGENIIKNKSERDLP